MVNIRDDLREFGLDILCGSAPGEVALVSPLLPLPLAGLMTFSDELLWRAERSNGRDAAVDTEMGEF